MEDEGSVMSGNRRSARMSYCNYGRWMKIFTSKTQRNYGHTFIRWMDEPTYEHLENVIEEQSYCRYEEND
ncbi:hypothetical protein E2542_SST00897 [Spatholobus suberectus]|nr:hypothetical protein E2542_SST00897 [Spatholobus suberectus]